VLPFPYGHGFLYTTGGWRTIMAYNDKVNCPGGPTHGYCTRLQYWSNPDIMYPDVRIPMGSPDDEDNARVLDSTDVTMAGFRQSDTMKMKIQNKGGVILNISSMTDNRAWLTTDGHPTPPFSVGALGQQDVEVIIDWLQVPSSEDVATLTITSDDPDEPTAQIMITAKPIPVPTNLNVENVTVDNGQTECYDATNIVTLAGSGTTFDVQSGANVEVIAGSKIYIKDGATIHTGANFHAHTTSTDDYCGDSRKSLFVETIDPPEEQPISEIMDALFKAYPNPTTGTLTIEINTTDDLNTVQLEVYDFIGRNIVNEQLQNIYQTNLNLSDYQSGMYIIKVTQGDRMEVQKIVKQ